MVDVRIFLILAFVPVLDLCLYICRKLRGGMSIALFKQSEIWRCGWIAIFLAGDDLQDT